LPSQQPFPAQQFRAVPAAPPVPPHAIGRSEGHSQVPALQVAPAAQTVSQAPQCDSSVFRFTQAPPQSASPAGHTQAFDVHVAPVAQTFPHEPQLASSVARSTHVEPHVSGEAAGHAQTPPTQTSFVSGHTFPQALQFRSSVSRFTQRGSWEPQYVAPTSHAHVPPPHVPRPQAIPHSPQFRGSLAYVAGSTQAPLQTTCPVGHAQAPALQVAPVGQRSPQVPQFRTFVARSTQPSMHEVCPDGQLSSPSHPEQRARSTNTASATRFRTGRVMPR
jgi:hypothetical protein